MKPPHAHGTFSVIAAFVGNIFVTIIKTIVAISSGSASMFAESVHSFADTLNQSLLLIGLKRSRRPADIERGYGYGVERFFWSLISACGILFIGAGITIFHSITTIIEGGEHVIETFNFSSLIVLAIAFVVEGATLIIALRELKCGDKFCRDMFRDGDPITLAVVYEDGAAVLGVVVAIISQVLAYYTGNPIFDAAGGIIIGFILGFLAIILITKNYSYLIGKSLNEKKSEEVIEFLLTDPCIEKVIECKSVAVDFNKYRVFFTVEWNGSPLYEEIYEAGDLKEEFEEVKEDFGEFTKLMFKTTDRIPRLIGNHINKIEKNMREKFPEIAYIDIEIN